MDAFYESGLNSWDRAAGLVVASEAGVRAVELELDGPSSGTTLVVAPAGLLDDLAALLRRGAAAT
jgi:myo-inositol-1(or 4)-monophosphatase